MAKLGKDKIALFLACASILGGKASAAQNIKTGQTVAAVGGATLKNNKNNLSAMDKSKSATDLSGRKIENKSFINKAVDWIKAKPGKAAAIGAGVIAATTAAVALPILLCKSKNSKPPQVIKDKGNNPKKDLKKNEIENQKEVQGENKGNPEGNLGEKPGENPEENPVENSEENPVKNLEEVKEEVKKEEKKEEIEIINIENPTVNTNYQKFDWENAEFSSERPKGSVANKVNNANLITALKNNYNIQYDFTLGMVETVYDGWGNNNKANLIIVDCNCTEFCKGGAGTVTGKDGTIAYCNGHGQIFILQTLEGKYLNYGEKNKGGNWKFGEKDYYYVDWHT